MYEFKVCMIYVYEAQEKLCFVLFQKCVPLKAFFPQSPQSLLVPLLTLPSGQCANTPMLCVCVYFWIFHSDTMHKSPYCEYSGIL